MTAGFYMIQTFVMKEKKQDDDTSHKFKSVKNSSNL